MILETTEQNIDILKKDRIALEKLNKEPLEISSGSILSIVQLMSPTTVKYFKERDEAIDNIYRTFDRTEPVNLTLNK